MNGKISIIFLSIGIIVAILISSQSLKANSADHISNDLKNMAKANNKFAFELYSQLSKSEKGNIFYSPLSIFTALAMTYEGARGQTADEMKSALHFSTNSISRQNFVYIYNEFNKKNKDYELKMLNNLWLQKGYNVLKTYKDNVKKYYSGEITNLDFINETEKSRQAINDLIRKNTNNKIRDLLSPDSVKPLTRLIITNAIYFKESWQWEFDKSKTKEQNFRINETKAIRTKMMSIQPDEVKFNYADLGNLQILELPYKGEKNSMLILLPSGDIKELENSLTEEKLVEYKNKMQKTKFDSIYIPKFKFELGYDKLKENLKEMGIISAFENTKADFSAITGNRELFISDIVHKAHIEVDEKGTEAAAATAAVMTFTAMPDAPEPIVFKADHPFIFIIQEKNTGIILFIGKVLDPTTEN